VASYNPDKGVESDKSDTVSVITPVQPPPNVEITADSTPSVHLSWDSVNGAVSYKIYKSQSSGNEQYYATVNAPQTTYTDLSVSPNKTYYYYITAVASDGRESPPSEEVSITISEISYQPPSNLKAEVLNDTSGNIYVHLTWTGVSGATEYKVYKGTSMGNEVYFATTSKTYFNDYSVDENETYYYYVTAVYGNSESSPSNEIKIKVILGAKSEPPTSGGGGGGGEESNWYQNTYIYATAGAIGIAIILAVISYRKRAFWR